MYAPLGHANLSQEFYKANFVRCPCSSVYITIYPVAADAVDSVAMTLKSFQCALTSIASLPYPHRHSPEHSELMCKIVHDLVTETGV